MFQLPTDPLPPTAVNPRVLALYGVRKVGKDTAAALWDADVHLDTDPGGGTAYLTTRRVLVPDLATLCGDPFAGEEEADRASRDNAKAESRRESVVYAIKAAYAAHKASGADRPYRVVLSMVNEVEMWAESWATALYKRSVQGKAFDLPSVYFLDRGLGYHLARERFTIIWRDLLSCCDELLVLCHQRDSSMDKGEQVSAAEDLDLTGKLRKVVASYCSALGYLQRTPNPNGNGDILSVVFQTRRKDMVVGTRVPRLEGKTFPLVYLSPDGFFCHGWEHIYLPAGRPPKWVKSSLRKDMQVAPEVPADGSPTT